MAPTASSVPQPASPALGQTTARVSLAIPASSISGTSALSSAQMVTTPRVEIVRPVPAPARPAISPPLTASPARGLLTFTKTPATRLHALRPTFTLTRTTSATFVTVTAPLARAPPRPIVPPVPIPPTSCTRAHAMLVVLTTTTASLVFARLASPPAARATVPRPRTA